MAQGGRRAFVRVVVGIGALLVGAILAIRPFASVAVLVVAVATGLLVAAASEFVRGTRSAPAGWLLGAAYVLGAGLVLGLPGITVTVIGWIVGLLLLSTGAVRIWAAVVSRTGLPELWVAPATARFTIALFSGLVTACLGVISLLWTDAVMLPMAVTLGIRLMLAGTGMLADLWYPWTEHGSPAAQPRLVWRAISVGLACVLAVAAQTLEGGRPAPSSFYYRTLSAATRSGQLLDAELYPTGMTGNAAALRLLYATEDTDQSMVATSAVLYYPTSVDTATLPLVVWAHGSTGIGQGCAPSVIGEQTGGLTGVTQLLAAGYAVVAPDYVGLGTPGRSSYLNGVSEGRDLLDAVRAAGQVPGIRLGGALIWGYDQGGHAALWAGQLASGYAPELSLAGVAAIAPLADPASLLDAEVKAGDSAALGGDLLTAYASRYPLVRVQDYVAPADRLQVAELAARCDGDDDPITVGWAESESPELWTTSPISGAFGDALVANIPIDPVRVPVLIQQGAEDDIVPESLTVSYVDRRCQAGQALDYRVYPAGHGDLLQVDLAAWSELMAWTRDRFAGKAAADTCPTS